MKFSAQLFETRAAKAGSGPVKLMSTSRERRAGATLILASRISPAIR